VSLLLGLFDRPADACCLKALWKVPAIPDLTEPLVGTSEAHRNLAFTRLQDAKLLSVNRDTAGALLVLDAHPLLREYFAWEPFASSVPTPGAPPNGGWRSRACHMTEPIYVLICGSSCRTTFNNELWTSMLPL
jgi:hypothetical protein